MILAHEPAIGTRHLGIACRLLHAEHIVGIDDARRGGARRLRPAPRARSLRAHAQHRFERGELERRDAAAPGRCAWNTGARRSLRPLPFSAASSWICTNIRRRSLRRPMSRRSSSSVSSSGKSGRLPSVKYSIARRTSASLSEKRRIAARAASISCSVTRPSDFATCPMTWKVARKNAALSSCGSAPAQLTGSDAGGRTGGRSGNRSWRRAAATHDRTEDRANDLAVPTHGFLDRRRRRLQHRALS